MANVATPRPDYVEDEGQRLLPLALQEGRPALLRDAGVAQEGRGAAPCDEEILSP